MLVIFHKMDAELKLALIRRMPFLCTSVGVFAIAVEEVEHF